MSPRPVFIVTFEATPASDGLRSLRALLKTAKRRFGLRCTRLATEAPPDPTPEQKFRPRERQLLRPVNRRQSRQNKETNPLISDVLSDAISDIEFVPDGSSAVPGYQDIKAEIDAAKVVMDLLRSRFDGGCPLDQEQRQAFLKAASTIEESEWLWGSADPVVRCPKCGERLEATTTPQIGSCLAQDLRAGMAHAPWRRARLGAYGRAGGEVARKGDPPPVPRKLERQPCPTSPAAAVAGIDDPIRPTDALPPEVRRGLAIAPVDFCPGCVTAADLRRHGLDWTVPAIGQGPTCRHRERCDGL